MSHLMGGKVSLELVKPHRYRAHYHIVVDEACIGEIELDHIAWRSGEAELKIEIFDGEMRGLGYGTDAVITLLRQAFLKMNLSRIYLRVQACNRAALRCYEKAGFKKEGRLHRQTDQDTKEEIFLMGITRVQFLQGPHPQAV